MDIPRPSQFSPSFSLRFSPPSRFSAVLRSAGVRVGIGGGWSEESPEILGVTGPPSIWWDFDSKVLPVLLDPKSMSS